MHEYVQAKWIIGTVKWWRKNAKSKANQLYVELSETDRIILHGHVDLVPLCIIYVKVYCLWYLYDFFKHANFNGNNVVRGYLFELFGKWIIGAMQMINKLSCLHSSQLVT